ncbi:hypothetical protein ACOMHN_010704 [Nucella lapillus]
MDPPPSEQTDHDAPKVTVSQNSVTPATDRSKSRINLSEGQSRLTVASGTTLPPMRTASSLHRRRLETSVEMMVDYNQMSDLRQAFLDRWDGEDLGLTKEEFQNVVRRTINMNMSDEDGERLFQQMDLKGTGLICWRDYITNIGQAALLRSYMAARAIKPLFQDKMQFINTKHRDEIVSIRFLPRLSLQTTKINYKRGRYLMLGRHGHMSTWSLNLTFISTYYIGATEGLNPLYFVDMVVLYPSTLIAVTSTDRKITLYELGSRGIQEKYCIVTLSDCVTCMDFWSDLCSRTTSLLVWGDTAGDIHALQMDINRLGGIFGKDESHEIITRVVYADLVKNKQSMLYSDWNAKVEPRYFQCTKSVLCFDYNHVINLLVTGSLDCRIRVWNFFMGQRPVSTLTAHTAPITNISLSANTNHVISVDKTRAIKVCNFREGTVIQSFSGPSLQCMGGRGEFTGFFFNMVRCQLIVATSMLAATSKRTNPPSMAEISAHDFPISALCYNSTFSEIISACANAVISVWDLHTGKHLLQFQHFSPKSRFQDLPWAKDNLRLEVTSMAMDPGQSSSVLTGANDGTINVWNFSTGVLISYYSLPENTLVTGLIVDRNSIFATGWFKYVYLLDREQQTSKDPPKCFSRYHTEEVNCMCVVKGGLLATGSYDGDVVIVTRDTGHPICVLNAGESCLPVPTQMKTDDDRSSTGGVLLEDEDGSSTFSGGSEEEMIMTEDHSILRCIRISDDLVMVSNAITGDPVRLLRKPRQAKIPEDNSKVFDALWGKTVSEEESAANFKAYESSVEAVLCLQTRKHLEASTADVFTAGAEGWIRAWSLNPQGGLKGQFLATEYLGEAVKTMVTDCDNEFLITGDTMGYIKVWDIFPYCNNAAKRLNDRERQQRREQYSAMFIYLRSPFLRDRAAEGFRNCLEFHKRLPPEESNPKATLKTPNLLNVFRAHMQTITCLQYVDKHKLILSGGKDCSVRVWTIKGSFVGQCGDPWVKLPDITHVTQPLRLLPHDIRRNASARTFRVIKSGCVPLWDRAVQRAKNYLEEKRREERRKTKRVEEQGKEVSETTVSTEEESMLTVPVPLGKDEPELPEDLRLCNVVSFDWKDPRRSHLLGKAFKPNLHHRHSPVPPFTIEDHFGMYPAYHKINVIDISHMTRIPTPDIVKDMEIRRREEEEEAQRWRSMKKKRSFRPAKYHHSVVARKDTRRMSHFHDSSPSQSGSDVTANRASSSQPTHTVSAALNNSAIDTNTSYGDTLLDMLDQSDTDLLDLGQPCIKAGVSAENVKAKSLTSSPPTKEHVHSDEDDTSTDPSLIKITSATTLHADLSRKETCFKNRSQNYSSETAEKTDSVGLNCRDAIDDDLDADDVENDVQDSDDGIESNDSYVPQKRCMFPPIAAAKQPTVTQTAKASRRSQPRMKTPNLPALWTKQVGQNGFKGTGLWFN